MSTAFTTEIITTIVGDSSLAFGSGGGPATSASFSFPAGLALDATGDLYIANQGNRVRKVSAKGTIATVAGNGSTGYSGDDGPAAAMR